MYSTDRIKILITNVGFTTKERLKCRQAMAKEMTKLTTK